MIYGYVAAFMPAPVPIAVSSHFLAAFHLRWRHRRIRQASEERRGRHEEGNEKRNCAAELHILVVLRGANAEKPKSLLDTISDYDVHTGRDAFRIAVISEGLTVTLLSP